MSLANLSVEDQLVSWVYIVVMKCTKIIFFLSCIIVSGASIMASARDIFLCGFGG